MRGEPVAAKPGADAPAHRRDEGGEIVELGLGQFADSTLAQHLLEQRGLERQRADIALDAAGIFGAFDQASKARRSFGPDRSSTGRAGAGASWPYGSDRPHHSAASRTALRTNVSAAIAAD